MGASKGPPCLTGRQVDHISPALRGYAVPVEALSVDPANVRLHSEPNIEAIKASLRTFGQQKPIVVDQRGRVIAGNGTLEAARQLGWTMIAAVRSDLKGAERAAFAIADNRTAELADWDERGLLRQLEALQEEMGVDWEAVGFSQEELDRLTNLYGSEGGQAGAGGCELPECFQVVVECRSEEHQRQLYERLTGEGLTCRLLVL
jgi:ParB family chromosome partitioning protein